LSLEIVKKRGGRGEKQPDAAAGIHGAGLEQPVFHILAISVFVHKKPFLQSCPLIPPPNLQTAEANEKTGKHIFACIGEAFALDGPPFNG
jgi:hypothetical protein